MLPHSSMARGLHIPMCRRSAASQLFIPCWPGQTAFQTASHTTVVLRSVWLLEAAHAVGLKPAACRAKAAAAAWMRRRRPASQRGARGFSRRAEGRTTTVVLRLVLTRWGAEAARRCGAEAARRRGVWAYRHQQTQAPNQWLTGVGVACSRTSRFSSHEITSAATRCA
jgi:hypothetical protein